MAEAFFRTLHMIGILGLAAGIIIAVMASRPSITRDDVSGLSKVYMMTLLALLITGLAGLSLWLWVGKPAAFFSNNPVFHAKMGLFVILIAVLTPGAVYFWRQNRLSIDSTDALIEVPATIRRLQKTAIPLLLVMPVLAYLMARGIGY